MTATKSFVCYCAGSKGRFPSGYLDDIRENVCQDLPFYAEVEGKQYCLLHYPSKDKAEDFERVFRQRIERGKWDFRVVWFPIKLHFENETFTHNAQFGSATFAASVTFKNCTFEGRFEFFNSKFLERAEFLYSKFSRSTNFNSARFREYGDFAFARFKQGASFDKSRFYKASFQGTHFQGEVDFTGTNFREYASFLQTKCFSAAKFINVSFPKSAETSFHDAEFHLSVNFDNSKFGRTDFKMTRFCLSATSPFEKATFKEVRFKGITRFSDAIFHTEADFTGSSFRSVAFERATFGGGVRFTGCDFLSNVYFHETKFGRKENGTITSGHAYFDYALFKEESRVFSKIRGSLGS